MINLAPTCLVCRRPDWGLSRNRLHPALCGELVGIFGSVETAQRALAVLQARCPHPSYGSDYEYDGGGRDKWWWCKVCHLLVYTNRPVWAGGAA